MGGYCPDRLEVVGVFDEEEEVVGYSVAEVGNDECALLSIDDVDDHSIELLREMVRRYNEFREE